MIYGLTNEDGEIRYVGRTTQKLKKRLAGHICDANKGGTSNRCEWIREIGKKNVDIVLLEENPEDESKTEVWWMEYAEFLGFDLTNEIRYETGVKDNRWKPPKEAIEMMGEVPDRKIAEKYDVSITLVLENRNELDIEPYMDRFGFKKELPQECINKLGEVSDNKLAKEYNVTPRTIKRRREKFGINAYEKTGKQLPDECIEQLGEVPDAKLAEEYGVDDNTIWRRRKERDISAYGR